MPRAIVIVLDGCGAGAAPDAADFGDGHGPNTLLHVWEAAGGIDAPRLHQMGYFAGAGVASAPTSPLATHGLRWGRLRELSMGKDSVTGHWEMMGVVTREAFPTYPEGFPIPLVKALEREIGTQTIGNRAASGTQIIADLGELHCDTGFPILYTSADSVLQLAAHEEVVPIETLYAWCETARRLCQEPDHVQRVIARPFVGSVGDFKRTERRKDYPYPAPPNLLDEMSGTVGVGVVPELFGGRGFELGQRTQSNDEHFNRLVELMPGFEGFLFANFEDFDMLYGHRNDPAGFGRCLAEFDVMLGTILEQLRPDDLFILTADHGNDPTDASTDHSREYVPVCVLAPGITSGPLGDVEGLTAIGRTVASHLGVNWEIGVDLLK